MSYTALTVFIDSKQFPEESEDFIEELNKAVLIVANMRTISYRIRTFDFRRTIIAVTIAVVIRMTCCFDNSICIGIAANGAGMNSIAVFFASMRYSRFSV